MFCEQVHSAFRLAYQVGLSGGCAERARVLASNVLLLVRMFLSKPLAFSSFSDEIDRVFSPFSSWMHVAGDIKQLVLTICSTDIQRSKEIERVVKLLAARNRKRKIKMRAHMQTETRETELFNSSDYQAAYDKPRVEYLAWQSISQSGRRLVPFFFLVLHSSRANGL